MSDFFFLLLLKGHILVLLLLKISLLLKYFLFLKYKSPDWKVHHLVYFAEKDIIFSENYRSAKVKKLQNSLSLSIIHFVLLIILIRFSLAIFF